MKKLQSFIIPLLLATLLLSVVSFAHSGRTDSQGGHRDGNTYHYHHGYSAHQHTNGVCPYNFNDQTRHDSYSSYKNYAGATGPNKTKDSDSNSIYLGTAIFLAICVLCSMPIFGVSSTVNFVLSILKIPLIFIGIFLYCFLHTLILPVCWALQILEFITRPFAKLLKLIDFERVAHIMKNIVLGLVVLAVIVFFTTLFPVDSEGFTCDNCGDYNQKLGSIVEVSVPDIGYYYCSDCLSDDVYRCINCGRFQGIGSGFVIETGLCDECSDQAYVSCFECGYEFPINTVIRYEELYICIPCVEKIIN